MEEGQTWLVELRLVVSELVPVGRRMHLVVGLLVVLGVVLEDMRMHLVVDRLLVGLGMPVG